MANKFKLNPTGGENDSIFKNQWAIGLTTGMGPTNQTGYYHGAEVPPGGWVIYKTNETQFTAKTPIDLLNFVSGLNGDSSNVENALFWLISNEFLVLKSDIESIITDKLVLYLDSNHLISYVFVGNTWEDLSGKERNGSLSNGPIHRENSELLFTLVDHSQGHPTNEQELDNIFKNGTNQTQGIHIGNVNWASSGQTPFWGGQTEGYPSYHDRRTSYGWKVEGFILLPEDGEYEFFVDSDDASDVFVDNTKVADFYGAHGFSNFTGNGNNSFPTTKTSGWYSFQARVEEGGGGDGIVVGWKKPSDSSISTIPAKYFSITNNHSSTFSFDGTNQQAVYSSTTSANHSVEVWFRARDLNSTQGLIGEGAYYRLYLSNDHLYWWNRESGSGTSTAVNYGSIDPGRWYQAVGVTESGNERKLFLNGIEVAQEDTSLNFDTGTTSGAIGNRWPNTSSFFNGDISVARKYNKSLSKSEILKNYNTTGYKFGYGEITEGLVLNLDAANPDCFSEGRTTANNLISNGLITGASGTPGTGQHNPNPSNMPSYNPIHGGVFDFDGGRGMNVEEDLGGSFSNQTLMLWIYRPDGEYTDYITDARNDGGDWFLSNYSGHNINYDGNLEYNFGGSYNPSHPDFIQKWIHIAVQTDETESRLYLNGEEVSSYNAQSRYDGRFGKNFRIGTRYTTSSEWRGYMNLIKAYNRLLKPEEIKREFEATKFRFGF